MKRAALLLAPLLALGLSAPAMAQKARAAKMAPGEITITNARAANLTELTLADETGKVVGTLKAALEAGKKVKLRLAKGTPCTVTVNATFDDESENAGGQVDVCADKTIRFTD